MEFLTATEEVSQISEDFNDEIQQIEQVIKKVYDVSVGGFCHFQISFRLYNTKSGEIFARTYS